MIQCYRMRHLIRVKKVRRMNRDKTSEYSRKRYTAGAMCFMLFVWLGGVLALVATAAVVMQ